MTSTHITTHQAEALARLLSQYAGKPLLAGLLNSMTAGIQSLEDTFFQILSARIIATATGTQLDNIGTVLGLTRIAGWTDATYQGQLLAQIGLNTSQGSPESVITGFSLYTGSSQVDYYEYYPADVALMGNVQVTNQELVDNLQTFLQAILPAGVSIDYYGYFDPTNAFAFAGGGGAGFGDATNPDVGGRFAALYSANALYFGFDGGDETDIAGFGDLNNAATGGAFSTLAT